MELINIEQKGLENFYCPRCGTEILGEKSKYCNHVLFVYDSVAGEIGYHHKDFTITVDDLEKESITLPKGSLCFKVITPGPAGMGNESYIGILMGNNTFLEQPLYSTHKAALETNLGLKRIQQLADEVISQGFAYKIGKVTIITQAGIDYIKNRPEKRGDHFKKKRTPFSDILSSEDSKKNDK